ncbi:MAG: aminotransferase, partial [Nannocystaceae bacterium]
APNTHELLVRLVSSIPRTAPLRVLSTDSEFHSFERQTRRWEEAGEMEVVRVPTEPFEDFGERFLRRLAEGTWDLVFVSQVFFNSGFVNPVVGEVVEALRGRPDTWLVIDGYHGFCALPTSLAALQDRAFYMSGGYKYAMAGEGACFVHCPAGWASRPVNTGWFAGFGQLADGVGDLVQYAADGMRLMGATFDPTPWFRFNAVWDLWEHEGISVGEIHTHVATLQSRFIEEIEASVPSCLTDATRVPGAAHDYGHFVTFRTDRAGEIHEKLRAREVLTDYRGDRLRFGVAIYHDAADVDRLVDVLRQLG